MFDTPNSNFNPETRKWDWEPGIFWKRDANNNRIVTSDVCPEQLANRTPEQECDDLIDIFAQALVHGYLLNEYHFNTSLEEIMDQVQELDFERGPARLQALMDLNDDFWKTIEQ